MTATAFPPALRGQVALATAGRMPALLSCYCCQILLANAMTQAMGSRYPNVVSLEIDSQDVVVRGRGLNGYLLLQLPCRVRDVHLRFVRIERRAVDRKIRPVGVNETFVRRKPSAVGVDCLDLAHEVSGQAAVLLQEVVPVASVVAARAEIGCHPENLVNIADGGRDLMDQALVFHYNHFGFAVGVVVVLPALGLLVVFE